MRYINPQLILILISGTDDHLRCCRLILMDGQCGKLVMVWVTVYITLTIDICVLHGGREVSRGSVSSR